MNAMRSHFHHWRRSTHGPKKGALVFADGTHQEFDLTNPTSTQAACDRLEESIGEVYLVPADGTYSGDGRTADNYVRGKTAPDLATAITNLREAIATKIAYEKRMADEPTFALEERLRRHDWTFAYSDDQRSWSAGNRNLQEIMKLVPQVPNAQEIWEKYAPEGYPFPQLT